MKWKPPGISDTRLWIVLTVSIAMVCGFAALLAGVTFRTWSSAGKIRG